MKRLAGIAALVFAVAACGDKQQESEKSLSLDAMVDSIMPRLTVVAGLEQRGPVKVRTQGKDSLRVYLERRMASELPAEELEAIRQVYVALGLLPGDLDLQRMLMDLYTEQVVGYYDPEQKTLFVVENAKTEEVYPVLVHELVHAIQDQHVNLDSLISDDRGNDRQTAAQAAIEGHATLVMFSLLAEQASGSPVDPRSLPDIGVQIRQGMEADNSQLPVFRSAPQILKETLLFPYAAGASFVHKLWLRPLTTGFGTPYPAPLADDLPHSTEQVLHPDSRFLVEKDEPTELSLEGDTTAVVYENTLGELETRIFLEHHLGDGSAASGWDGDRFRLLNVPGGRVLVWYSIWDDVRAADRFAMAYRQIAGRRANRAIRVERIDINGRPGVRVLDADRQADSGAVPLLTPRVAG